MREPVAESNTSSGVEATSGWQRRQRRQSGGRRRAFLVRVTDAEQLALIDRAAGAGLSVPRLMVEASLADDGRTLSERRALVSDLSAAKRIAAALGNNLALRT
jgi:hypothetical protein